MSDVTALVVENDPTDDICRLGTWLTEAGLGLHVVRPHAGDELPETLDGYDALVVLGGEQDAFPDESGRPGAPWFPALESLLRKAVRTKVPTLGICLGGQLLAQAHGGVVGRATSGPEYGPVLVARRDAAENDAVWQYVPFMPDVIAWHRDEILELPRGATLLAASTRYPIQAFRIGERAWGTQFHFECDADMIMSWAADTEGVDAAEIVAEAAAVLDDMADVWEAFAIRFVAVVRGELSTSPGRSLPLLGH